MTTSRVKRADAPLSVQIPSIIDIAAWLSDLAPNSRRTMLESCQPLWLRRGTYVFRQGDPIKNISLLVKGRVKIVQETADGNEVLMRLVQPGELFGEILLDRGAEHRKTALALADSTVILFPIDMVNEVSADPMFTRFLLDEMATRLRDAEARICDLQTEPVRSRLARTLLRLSRRADLGAGAGATIVIPITRAQMAELCGTTMTTASRIFSQWSREGLIESKRGTITVLQPGLLAGLMDV